MRMSEVIDANAHSRERGKKVLHHVEIYPDREKDGRPKLGAGHQVKIIHRKPEGWDETSEDKHFGDGEGHEMLAHVANALHVKPEPSDGDGDEGGTGAAE